MFNTFTMGVTVTGVNQTNSTLTVSDNLSKVIGAHTLKVGGQFQFGQVRLEPNATFNGTFSFAGTETGSDFADFLLGIPSNYIQSSGGIFNLRNKYGAVFAQDSWRPRSNLTVNYGLRWDHHRTVVRAKQSNPDHRARAAVHRVSGCADGAGVPDRSGHRARTFTGPLRKYFSARRHRAYSPGSSDKTSIRASFGRFYTAFQGLSAGIMYGVPPYGYNYLSPAPPLFETPFITAADGTNNGQRFPLAPPPLDASAEQSVRHHQLAELSAGQRRPVLLPVTIRVPYSDNFMASIEHELAPNMVADRQLCRQPRPSHGRDPAGQSWQPRPLLERERSQPGGARQSDLRALCGERRVHHRVRPGDQQHADVLGPNYGTMTSQDTNGYARYNALELNLRYGRANGNVSIGYTYSKSVDVASNLGEQVNPFDITARKRPRRSTCATISSRATPTTCRSIASSAVTTR